MEGQYTIGEVVQQCREKCYSLLADLDSVDVTEDENELACSVEDAGNFFLGVAEECDA